MFSVIILEIPHGNVELICIIKIESVSFKIDGKQSLRIYINNIETGGFSLISGNRTNDEVY